MNKITFKLAVLLKKTIGVIIFIIISLSLFSQFYNCINPYPSKGLKLNMDNNDSIPVPLLFSPKAKITNFGSEDQPVYTWYEPSNLFFYRGKHYNHILGVKYYYVLYDQTDTAYYENIDVRSGNISVDYKNIEILPLPGGGTIKVSSYKDSFLMFQVLEDDRLKSEFNGVVYRRVPLAQYDEDNNLVYGGECRLNIKKSENVFLVTFLNDSKPISEFKYNGSKLCSSNFDKISFVDKTNGFIYFIDKNCYIEPLEDKDNVLTVLSKL